MNIRLILAFVILLLLAACGPASGNGQPPPSPPPVPGPPEPPLPPRPPEEPEPEPEPEPPPPGPPVPEEPPTVPEPIPNPPGPPSPPAPAPRVPSGASFVDLVGNPKWRGTGLDPCAWANGSDVIAGTLLVTDQNGQPLSGVEVRLHAETGMEYEHPAIGYVELGPTVQHDNATDAGGRASFRASGGYSSRVRGAPRAGTFVPFVLRGEVRIADRWETLATAYLYLESQVDAGDHSNVFVEPLYHDGKGWGKEVMLKVARVTGRPDCPDANGLLAGRLVEWRWQGTGVPPPDAPNAPLNEYAMGAQLKTRGGEHTFGDGTAGAYYLPRPADEDQTVVCFVDGVRINDNTSISMEGG